VDRFGKMLDEWDIKRVARHLDRATYVPSIARRCWPSSKHSAPCLF
jgi:hypothetical protein